MNNFGNVVLTSIMTLLIVAVIVGALIAFPIEWLWNGLMPSIFGLHPIDFLQAWGLNILSALLLKSSSTTTSTN